MSSPKVPAAQSTIANVATAPEESRENSLASSVASFEQTADSGGLTEPGDVTDTSGGLEESSPPTTETAAATDQSASTTLQVAAAEATALTSAATFAPSLVINASSPQPQKAGEF